MRAEAPPFTPEYTKLPQRIRLLGLPPTGKEKYHMHALMRIYQDGLLVPVPANVGIDLKRKVISPIHTHDATGVLHFESDKPFPHTLGDVFEVWGLTLGPGQIGSLKNGDGRTLRVYVNGKRVADPATYEVKKNDVIVIRYDDGSQNVPLNPDTTALKDANAGKGLCGASNGQEEGEELHPHERSRRVRGVSPVRWLWRVPHRWFIAVAIAVPLGCAIDTQLDADRGRSSGRSPRSSGSSCSACCRSCRARRQLMLLCFLPMITLAELRAQPRPRLVRLPAREHPAVDHPRRTGSSS